MSHNSINEEKSQLELLKSDYKKNFHLIKFMVSSKKEFADTMLIYFGSIILMGLLISILAGLTDGFIIGPILITATWIWMYLINPIWKRLIRNDRAE